MLVHSAALSVTLFFNGAAFVELLDVRPKVVRLLLIINAGEDHFCARDSGSRIFYVFLGSLFPLDNTGVFVCIAIAVVWNGTCLSPVEAIKFGTNFVLRTGTNGVAGLALLKHVRALLDVLRPSLVRLGSGASGQTVRSSRQH